MYHSFDTNIAKMIGVMPSIILNHIYFWVEHNRANESNFYDGYYWTYNSCNAFSELFPYMTKKQIRTSLDTLVKCGYIIKGNYNQSRYDRTTWYALTKEGYDAIEKLQVDLLYGTNGLPLQGKSNCPTGQMDSTNKANGLDSQGEPIPYINTDIKQTIKNQYNNPPISPKKKTDKDKQFEIYNEIKDNYNISEPLRDEIENWLDYKAEIKKTYTSQTGLKNLLKKFEKSEQDYGTSKVISVIDDSMANNYQGIVWDWLEKKTKPNNNNNNQRDLFGELRDC